MKKENKAAKVTSKRAKPLTRKEIEKQLQSGKLTREQEYIEDQRFVTFCGGIRPLPILPPPDKED